jgi:hypothetical protein
VLFGGGVFFADVALTMAAVSAFAIPGLSPHAVDLVPHLFHKAGFDRKATLVAYLGGFLSRPPAYCVARIHRIQIHIVVFFHFCLGFGSGTHVAQTGHQLLSNNEQLKKNLLSGAEDRRGRKTSHFSTS